MSKMICPKAKECKSETCPHKGKHDKWITCDDSYTGNCGKCIPVEEEKKMKCPKCGTEYDDSGWGHLCPEKPKPNPSPRDIFAHIKTDCERKAFDEFMTTCTSNYGCSWETRLSNVVLDWIKKIHPSRYQWLIQKGLVEKKKVKKQAFLGFWRDQKGILRIMGATGLNEFFTPALYATYNEAADATRQYKNIPNPVKIEWEEDDER